MKGFLKKVAAKLGCERNESEEREDVAAKDGRDGDTCKEERVKGLYQRCPLSSYNGGCCLFAWWYTGTLHCFYGNGDTVIEKKAKGGVVLEQPNVMCPKRAMWLEAKKRKLEKLKWEQAMRDLAEAEYMDGIPKTE